MEFLSDFNPSAAKVFGYFFTISFATLALILVIGLVGKVPHIRRGLRQLIARRTRKQRMLADHQKLRADALKLEGLYYFDEANQGLPPEEVYEEVGDNRTSDAA